MKKCTKTCQCGQRTTLDRCTKCRDQDIIEGLCRLCKVKVYFKRNAKSYFNKRGGKACAECCSKISSNTLRVLRAGQSSEEKSQMAKLARSQVKNSSDAVKKQWMTIKGDPVLFAKISDAHSKRSQKMWDDYTDQERHERIKKSFSDGRPSKPAQEMKTLMIGAGICGFISEEVFHGFIPDEINHELKIIVEFYGDLYHCNPDKFKNSEIFLRAINRKVGEQWKRDEIRLASFYRNGYTVVIIWESDFKENPDLQIERIKTEIERKKNGLHAFIQPLS